MGNAWQCLTDRFAVTVVAENPEETPLREFSRNDDAV